MRALLGRAEVDRQQRLRALQRLDTRLRVHRHHDLPLRRVQVQADDVADLVLEPGILRDLESTPSPRLQTVVPPQPRHPGLDT